MRARVMTTMRHTRGFGAEHYTPTPTAEIDICLNCPLPDCNRVKCDRFREEVKKIPNRRRRKR